MTIHHWIQREQRRRYMNYGYYGSLYAFVIVTALYTGNIGVVLLSGVIFLFQGMGNLCGLLSLSGDGMESSDAEIREAAESGPRWFKKLVQQLDKSDNQ